MSVYNKATRKIYPDLNSTAPSQQEVNPKKFRLGKISEAEIYYLNEITKREKLTKKI